MTRPKTEGPRRGLLLTGAVALLALSGTAHAQLVIGDQVTAPGTPQNPAPIFKIEPGEAISPTTLYLAVGRVEAAQAKAPESLADAVRDANPLDRHVIQLDGPLTPERKERLEDAGFVILDYLPTNAFVTRFSGADAQKASGLEFVRWHNAYETNWKINPSIGQRQYVTPERQAYANADQYVLNVSLFKDADVNPVLDAIAAIDPDSIHFLNQHVGDQIVVNVAVAKGVVEQLAEIPGVQFLDEAPEATKRNVTTNWVIQSGVQNQNTIHDRGLRGEDQIIAVSDGRIDIDHCAFTDFNPIGPTHRKIQAYNAPLSAFDSHGTHVAGTAVGDDGSAGDNRGVAFRSRLVFDDIPSFADTPMYQMLETHHNQGARIHTNSWGQDFVTDYTSLTRGIDRFSYDFEESLVLFASTNQFALFTPENAKNVLAVGATLDAPNQDFHFSGGVGPTNDGRRKPEIYAPGSGTRSASVGTDCALRTLGGTSMATPGIAGAAALARQYYVSGFYPTGELTPGNEIVPSGALLKATLLNSTVDMTGISGFPSELEGWGRILLDNALFFQGEDRQIQIEDVRNAEGLSTGVDSEPITFTVTSNAEPLNVTLVFTEPPAAVGTMMATVNDLDLEVRDPSGTLYRGNFFANGVSAPNGEADPINNVESVRVTTPRTGPWTVTVKGTAVNEDTQGYAVVINGALDTVVSPLRVSLRDPLPEFMDPGTTETFAIDVAGEDTLVDGSLRAFVATNGENFSEITLTQTDDSVFEGVLGPFGCSQTPRLFVVAQGTESGDRIVAGASESAPHEIAVGESTVVLADDFESDLGWTVDPQNTDNATSGAWERAVSQATAAQPGFDSLGNSNGTVYVTATTAGLGPGSNDVDGGRTTLLSPLLDLSGLTSATITYSRWFSNGTGNAANQDTFLVDISDDNGLTWTSLEVVGPSGAGVDDGWNSVEFKAEDFVELTSTVRVRFTAQDFGAGSIVEAAIDRFGVSDFVCDFEGISLCTADLNGDLSVNLDDFSILAAQFGNGPGDCTGGCTADFDGDGLVDLDDFAIFAAQFGNTASACAP